MLRLNIKRLKKYNPRLLFAVRTLGYFILLFPLAVIFSYHFAYWGKSFPGVSVGELRLGNRSREELIEELGSYFSNFEKKSLEVCYGTTVIFFDLDEFGFYYNVQETADKVLKSGRSKNIIYGFLEKWELWRRGKSITPIITFSAGGLGDLSSSVAAHSESPSGQPELKLSKNGDIFVTNSSGAITDRVFFEQQVVDSLESFCFSVDGNSSLLPIDFSQLDWQEYLPRAQDFVNASVNISLESENLVFTVTPEELLSFIDLYAFLDYDQNPKIEFKPNLLVLTEYSQKIADLVNREPQVESFKVENPEEQDSSKIRITSFLPSLSGRYLDRQRLVLDLTNLLEDGDLNDPKTVALSVSYRQPESPPQVNPWGLKELVGVGETNYAGSSANRIHNLILGASRLHGILIAPNQEFSFNQGVGEVTNKTGYKSAYVIAEGRTVLGVGGGMCQVSTTLFRAALDAGLPITERLAHDYRVHYYEPPVGMDATVYAPSVDLRFVNDTADYLLIQTEVIPEKVTLKFYLYGVKDSRQVEIGEPIIYYQTPPPAPLYQDDPSLPVGTIKQIDWAAWGAKVSVSRKVIKDGEVLQDDTFVSMYRPWQAIYLRGTGV